MLSSITLGTFLASQFDNLYSVLGQLARFQCFRSESTGASCSPGGRMVDMRHSTFLIGCGFPILSGVSTIAALLVLKRDTRT